MSLIDINWIYSLIDETFISYLVCINISSKKNLLYSCKDPWSVFIGLLSTWTSTLLFHSSFVSYAFLCTKCPFPCYQLSKLLFMLWCSLQVLPPSWSIPWLLLIPGFWCPLSWAFLSALERNSFLFFHSPCTTTGHKHRADVLFTSCCCLKTTFLLFVKISISAPLKHMPQMRSPLPLSVAIINHSPVPSLIKEFDTWSPSFPPSSLLISIFVDFNIGDGGSNDLSPEISYLSLSSFLTFYFVLNSFRWTCSHHYNETVVVRVTGKPPA